VTKSVLFPFCFAPPRLFTFPLVCLFSFSFSFLPSLQVAVEDAFALPCGHWFCKDCWASYLTSAINAGRECVYAVCFSSFSSLSSSFLLSDCFFSLAVPCSLP
jgi:hypothetical protein